jgi:hypothetical protein
MQQPTTPTMGGEEGMQISTHENTYGSTVWRCSHRDADGSGVITIEKSEFSFYNLGQSMRAMAGSPGSYEDKYGNRYLQGVFACAA